GRAGRREEAAGQFSAGQSRRDGGKRNSKDPPEGAGAAPAHTTTEQGKPYEDEVRKEELTDRQRMILEAMLENEITSERRRMSRAKVVTLVNRNHNAQNYSRDFAALVKSHLLCSREGPAGGVWLSPQGKAEAHRLRTSS